MIYVSKNELSQVEYLIDQSKKGNHVLFDLDSLRRIFWKENPYFNLSLSEQESYAVEHHIERLIKEPSLAQKRAYLEALDQDTYEMVVKTYFNIVENNIYEKLEVQH